MATVTVQKWAAPEEEKNFYYRATMTLLFFVFAYVFSDMVKRSFASGSTLTAELKNEELTRQITNLTHEIKLLAAKLVTQEATLREEIGQRFPNSHLHLIRNLIPIFDHGMLQVSLNVREIVAIDWQFAELFLEGKQVPRDPILAIKHYESALAALARNGANGHHLDLISSTNEKIEKIRAEMSNTD